MTFNRLETINTPSRTANLSPASPDRSRYHSKTQYVKLSSDLLQSSLNILLSDAIPESDGARGTQFTLPLIYVNITCHLHNIIYPVIYHLQLPITFILLLFSCLVDGVWEAAECGWLAGQQPSIRDVCQLQMQKHHCLAGHLSCHSSCHTCLVLPAM